MKIVRKAAIAAIVILPSAALAQGGMTNCNEFTGWSQEERQELIVELVSERMGAGMSDETAGEITALASEGCDRQPDAQLMNIVEELPLGVEDEPVQE